MKSLTYLLTACALFVMLTTAGCKKDDDDGPTVEEEQLNALNGTWTATSVMNDDAPREDYFDPAAFQITFDGTAKTYTTNNGPDLLPFPPSGNFELDPENVTSVMIINTDYQLNYSISSDGVLTMSIQNYSGDGYSNVRAESVVGNWVFKFEK